MATIDAQTVHVFQLLAPIQLPSAIDVSFISANEEGPNLENTLVVQVDENVYPHDLECDKVGEEPHLSEVATITSVESSSNTDEQLHNAQQEVRTYNPHAM